jgi:hypothetical protein
MPKEQFIPVDDEQMDACANAVTYKPFQSLRRVPEIPVFFQVRVARVGAAHLACPMRHEALLTSFLAWLAIKMNRLSNDF